MNKKVVYLISCVLLILSVTVTYILTKSYVLNQKIEKKYLLQESNKNNIEFDSLIVDAINNGNKQSFKKALISRALIEGDTQLFYYSLIMANKHNDWRACEYVFNMLNYEKNDGLFINGIAYFTNDETTKKMATYYLLKSYEFGNPDSLKYDLKKMFPNIQKIPNSEDFLKEK